jgi:fructose-1,6-bisphosphatase II
MQPPWESTAFGLAKVTEAAALAAFPFAGKKNGDAADAAAARAIRAALHTFGRSVHTVIGEGEKDGVEHVAAGEVFGKGEGDGLDLALDPIDGTSRLNFGRGGAVAAAALAPRHGLFDPGPSHYMKKVVCSLRASTFVRPHDSAGDIVRAVARGLDKAVSDVTVFVLDKPRHAGLIAEILAAGATVRVEDAGDLEGAVLAALPDTDIDVLLGTGGSPEGIVSACAVRAAGGVFYGKLDPQRPDEDAKLRALGLYPGEFLPVDILVPETTTAFALTGITEGTLCHGVRARAGALETETLLLFGPERGVIRMRRIHPAPSAPSERR